MTLVNQQNVHAACVFAGGAVLNAIKSYSKAEPGSYDVVVRLILLRVQEISIIFRVLSFSSNKPSNLHSCHSGLQQVFSHVLATFLLDLKVRCFIEQRTPDQDVLLVSQGDLLFVVQLRHSPCV